MDSVGLYCNGFTRAGNPCQFLGKILASDGLHYCGFHNPARPTPRYRTNNSRINYSQALALLSCCGITKKGTVCKNIGSRIHNSCSYCHLHYPVLIDLSSDDPQRPIVQYGDVGVNVEDDCPICFKCLKLETIVKTNCGHSFHQGCIDKWLSTNPSCPMCRTVTHIKRGNVRRIEVIEYN